MPLSLQLPSWWCEFDSRHPLHAKAQVRELHGCNSSTLRSFANTPANSGPDCGDRWRATTNAAATVLLNAAVLQRVKGRVAPACGRMPGGRRPWRRCRWGTTSRPSFAHADPSARTRGCCAADVDRLLGGRCCCCLLPQSFVGGLAAEAAVRPMVVVEVLPLLELVVEQGGVVDEDTP